MNPMTNGEAEQYLPPWVEKKKYELLGVGQGRGRDRVCPRVSAGGTTLEGGPKIAKISKTPFKKFNVHIY